MEIKLTGWKAVVGTLLIVGWGAFRYVSQTKAMESQGVEVIQNWLVFESARAVLPEMEKALENVGENQQFLEESANALRQDNFEIVSVTRHGVGRRVVARVEVRHQGTTSIRYLRMSYVTINGWQVGFETTRMDYFLAIL